MTNPEEIKDLISVDYSDITQITIMHSIEDASYAIREEGCRLLAVAPQKEPNDEEPFHYLVGLPSGTKVGVWLQEFFYQ